MPNGPRISNSPIFPPKDLEPRRLSCWKPGQGADGAGRARILSISDDAGLGESRELVLQGAGYFAATVDSHSPLGVAFVRTFDAAIVCQSLHPDCAARLAERLHRYHPGIRVLRIRLMASDLDVGYDGICYTLAGPRNLLNSITEILKKNRRGGSQVPLSP